MPGSTKRDIILTILVLVLPSMVYCYAGAVFDMHTQYYDTPVMISIAVVVLVFTFYLTYKYLKERTEKIVAMIGPALGLSVALWVLIAFNYIKVPMLISMWQTPVQKSHLIILETAADKTKGTLNGGKITAVYEGKKYIFYSSRTMYFALKDKESMDADIGISLDRRNIFVTKVYLSEAAYATARKAYWDNWWDRKKILLIILVIFVAAVFLLIALDRLGILKLEAKMGKVVLHKKPGPGTILFRILLFFMLTGLGLMLYILFKIVTNR